MYSKLIVLFRFFFMIYNDFIPQVLVSTLIFHAQWGQSILVDNLLTSLKAKAQALFPSFITAK